MKKQGMSLISVVVAIVLSGMVTVGVLQIMNLFQRSVKGTEETAETAALIDSVRMALMNPVLATCNLAPSVAPGPYFIPAVLTATSAIAIPGIKLFNTGCTSSTNLFVKGTALSNGLKVTTLELKNFFKVDDSNYFADLHFIVEKSGRGAAPSPISRNIFVSLQTLTTAGPTIKIIGARVGGASPSPILASGFLEDAASGLPIIPVLGTPALVSLSQNINIPQAGIVIITAWGHGLVSYAGVPPAGSYPDQHVQVVVDGISCSIARDISAPVSGNYHNVGTCVKELTAGAHTLAMNLVYTDYAGSTWTKKRVALEYAVIRKD